MSIQEKTEIIEEHGNNGLFGVNRIYVGAGSGQETVNLFGVA